MIQPLNGQTVKITDTSAIKFDADAETASQHDLDMAIFLYDLRESL
jgi:hypothetical protein